MEKNVIINRFQLWLLITNFLIGSALVFTPSKVAKAANQDGWLAIVIATIFGFFVIYLTLTLSKRHNYTTIIEICKELLGKPIGKILGLLFAWFYLHLAAILLREIGDMIKLTLLDETPLFVIILIITIMLFTLAYNEIEVIVRSNEILSPLAIIGFWLTIFLVIPMLKPENILPILSEGIKPVLNGSFKLIGFTYGEMAIFFMIIPFVDKQKNLYKIISLSGIVAGITLLATVISSIMVLGVEHTKIAIIAPYSMARLIQIGGFLRGVEILIVLTYIITILIKMTAAFFAGVLAVSQVFEIEDYRTILTPIILIVLALSLILTSNIVEFLDYTSTAWAPYALTFSLVIPLALLGISLIKGKK